MEPALRSVLDASPPQRILVMGREHIGDLVNTTGALLQLRKRFPRAHMVLECGERAVGVFENFPGLDEVWSRPTHQGLAGKIAFVQRVKAAKFDLGIILDDSNTYIHLLSLAKVPMRVGVFKSKRRKLFTACVPFDPAGHDLFDPLRGVLGLLGIEEPDLAPRVFPSNADRGAALAALSETSWDQRTPLVGLCPGASVPEKQWPPERFAEVASSLQAHTVVFGSGSERELADQIGRPWVAGLDSVLGFASAIGLCDVIVTNDSGPAHLASAVDTPAVVIYGPSDPVRFHPYSRSAVLLRGNNNCDLYRRQCEAKLRGEPCDGRCLRRVEVREVVTSVASLLESKRMK